MEIRSRLAETYRVEGSPFAQSALPGHVLSHVISWGEKGRKGSDRWITRCTIDVLFNKMEKVYTVNPIAMGFLFVAADRGDVHGIDLW